MIMNQIVSGEGGGGLDTYDATAYPEHILEGYTAYVRGAKITGTYKPPDSELDMDATYSILLITGTGANADAAITITTLIALGHTAIQISLSTFLDGYDTSNYDILFITNCADTNDKVFRGIYEDYPNVLFGYFMETTTRNTIYDIGVATYNLGDSGARSSFIAPIEHPITHPITKDISINMMDASNFGMFIRGLLVGTPLSSRDAGGNDITLVAIEAGTTSLEGVNFNRRTCVFGWSHGRGGYTIANRQMLDRAIRWIIQGNSKL
jgi:hypothetical protein